MEKKQNKNSVFNKLKVGLATLLLLGSMAVTSCVGYYGGGYGGVNHYHHGYGGWGDVYYGGDVIIVDDGWDIGMPDVIDIPVEHY